MSIRASLFFLLILSIFCGCVWGISASPLLDVMDECGDDGLSERIYLGAREVVLSVGKNGGLSSLACVGKVSGDPTIATSDQIITVIIDASNDPLPLLYEFTAGRITVIGSDGEAHFTFLYQGIDRIELFFSNRTNACPDVRFFDALPDTEMILHFPAMQPQPPPDGYQHPNNIPPQSVALCRHQMTICQLRSATLVTGAVDISVGSHIPRTPLLSWPVVFPQPITPLPWYAFASFPLDPLAMPPLRNDLDSRGDGYNYADGWPAWMGGSDTNWRDLVLNHDICYNDGTPISTKLPDNPLELLQGVLLLAPTLSLSPAIISNATRQLQKGEWIRSVDESGVNLALVERSRIRVLIASHTDKSQGIIADGTSLYLYYPLGPPAEVQTPRLPSEWLCAISHSYGISSDSCVSVGGVNYTAPAIVFGDWVDVTLRSRDGDDHLMINDFSANIRLSVATEGGDDQITINGCTAMVQLYTGDGKDKLLISPDIISKMTVDIGDDSRNDLIKVNTGYYRSNTRGVRDDWISVSPMGPTANSVIYFKNIRFFDSLYLFEAPPPPIPRTTKPPTTTTTTTTRMPSTTTKTTERAPSTTSTTTLSTNKASTLPSTTSTKTATTTTTTTKTTSTSTSTPVGDCCDDCSCSSCSICTVCDFCGWCGFSGCRNSIAVLGCFFDWYDRPAMCPSKKPNDAPHQFHSFSLHDQYSPMMVSEHVDDIARSIKAPDFSSSVLPSTSVMIDLNGTHNAITLLMNLLEDTMYTIKALPPNAILQLLSDPSLDNDQTMPWMARYQPTDFNIATTVEIITSFPSHHQSHSINFIGEMQFYSGSASVMMDASSETIKAGECRMKIRGEAHLSLMSAGKSIIVNNAPPLLRDIAIIGEGMEQQRPLVYLNSLNVPSLFSGVRVAVNASTIGDLLSMHPSVLPLLAVGSLTEIIIDLSAIDRMLPHYDSPLFHYEAGILWYYSRDLLSSSSSFLSSTNEWLFMKANTLGAAFSSLPLPPFPGFFPLFRCGNIGSLSIHPLLPASHMSIRSSIGSCRLSAKMSSITFDASGSAFEWMRLNNSFITTNTGVHLQFGEAITIIGGFEKFFNGSFPSLSLACDHTTANRRNVTLDLTAGQQWTSRIEIVMASCTLNILASVSIHSGPYLPTITNIAGFSFSSVHYFLRSSPKDSSAFTRSLFLDPHRIQLSAGSIIESDAVHDILSELIDQNDGKQSTPINAIIEIIDGKWEISASKSDYQDDGISSSFIYQLLPYASISSVIINAPTLRFLPSSGLYFDSSTMHVYPLSVSGEERLSSHHMPEVCVEAALQCTPQFWSNMASHNPSLCATNQQSCRTRPMLSIDISLFELDASFSVDRFLPIHYSCAAALGYGIRSNVYQQLDSATKWSPTALYAISSMAHLISPMTASMTSIPLPPLFTDFGASLFPISSALHSVPRRSSNALLLSYTRQALYMQTSSWSCENASVRSTWPTIFTIIVALFSLLSLTVIVYFFLQKRSSDSVYMARIIGVSFYLSLFLSGSILWILFPVSIALKDLGNVGEEGVFIGDAIFVMAAVWWLYILPYRASINRRPVIEAKEHHSTIFRNNFLRLFSFLFLFCHLFASIPGRFLSSDTLSSHAPLFISCFSLTVTHSIALLWDLYQINRIIPNNHYRTLWLLPRLFSLVFGVITLSILITDYSDATPLWYSWWIFSFIASLLSSIILPQYFSRNQKTAMRSEKINSGTEATVEKIPLFHTSVELMETKP